MILYITQTIACQLLFLVVYDLFLKKETFFNWNRVYLIASSLLSFFLPLIKIERFKEVVPTEYVIALPEILLTPDVVIEETASSWNWLLYLGIAVSLGLFIYKLYQIISLKINGVLVHKGKYKIIKIRNSSMSFSFFNYVFIGDLIEEEALSQIMEHEMVHINQKHSIDLFYFEMLRIVFWFNPLLYVYQKRISELHEYIADASVVKFQGKKAYYQKLLSEVFQTKDILFINQFFNHSLIKKRIIMLTKQKSKEILKLKYLLLVPVLLGFLIYTSCSDNLVKESSESKNIEELWQDVETAQANFNAYSKEIGPVEMMTKEQYTKLNELQLAYFEAIRTHDLAKDGVSEILPIMRSYEEYVAARKADMKVVDSYETSANGSVEFKSLDKVPVYPDCDENLAHEELKRCFTQKVAMHVNKNFNMKLAEELNLIGRQRLFVKFVVNKEGEIIDALARAPHPKLAKEAERVIYSLPKFKPGMKDGKSVKVKYVLPITFQINQ